MEINELLIAIYFKTINFLSNKHTNTIMCVTLYYNCIIYILKMNYESFGYITGVIAWHYFGV